MRDEASSNVYATKGMKPREGIARQKEANDRMPDKTPSDRSEYHRENIEKNAFNDQSKESLERLMESLKRVALGELSQGQIDAANSLRNELERFMWVGKATNLLCGRIRRIRGLGESRIARRFPSG